MTPYRRFRLSVIGQLGAPEPSGPVTLVTLAEYREGRVLERFTLRADGVCALIAETRSLRGFIEAGFPPYDLPKLQALGTRLFDFILRDEVRDMLLRAAGAERQILPLEISVEDSAIAGWPWEYLYDASNKKFVCQEFHPVSRGIFTPFSPGEMLQLKRKMRVLFLLGVLPQDPKTQPGEEIKVNKDVFEAMLNSDRVEVEYRQGLGRLEVDQELFNGDYDILYFFGHGGYDAAEKQGYLRLDRPGNAEPERFYAKPFADALFDRHLRLVFLNACESGRGAVDADLASSAVAAAVVERGVPAVIAAQYSIPAKSAHYLSSLIFKAVMAGIPLVEALRHGRRATTYAPSNQFCDWGIPVLYASNPDLVLFPAHDAATRSASDSKVGRVIDTDEGNYRAPVEGSEGAATEFAPPSLLPPLPNDPSPVAVEHKMESPHKATASVRVALLDIDANAGFLPEIVEAANRAQGYYSFRVVYAPIPSGATRTDLSSDGPQLFLPRLADHLARLPSTLDVEYVVGLTSSMIAFEEDGFTYSNYFAGTVDPACKVCVISTYNIREYAAEAGISFAKATLGLALSMLICCDPRWGLDYHKKSVGCPLDFCENRHDIVAAFRRHKFDHPRCRKKVKDTDQLAAIDALMDLEA